MATVNSLVYLVYSLMSLVAHDRPTPIPSPRAWEVSSDSAVTDSWSSHSIVEKYNEESCPSGERWDKCDYGCEHTCEYIDGPLICPRMCLPGCICENGKVRGPNGQCVAPSRCPSPHAPSSVLSPVCQQEKEVGNCKARMPRYFYNQETQQCELFIYGGCGGNENNFESKDECESQCRSASMAEQDSDSASAWSSTEPQFSALNPICQQDAKVGPCRASIPRYFYNQDKRRCEKFMYGGCRGNQNNFRSKDECESTCRSASMAEQVSDSASAWSSTEPQFSALNAICQLDAEVGPCKAYVPRYFYNQDKSRCEKFIYGGCGGNENNFKSKDECESTCRSASFAAQETDSTSSWRVTEYPSSYTYAEQDPDLPSAARSIRNGAQQWASNWNQQYPSISGSNAEQYPRVDPDDVTDAEQYSAGDSDNRGCPNTELCTKKCRLDSYQYGICTGPNKMICECVY